MADALTDEDRQQATRAFEEEEAEAGVLNGTKRQRYPFKRGCGLGWDRSRDLWWS